MSSEQFFSRWSRRKREVRRGDQPVENVAEQNAEPAAPEHPSEAAALEGGNKDTSSETELSADEIAALPSIEELTAEADISVFLRKGVPERLRNAALRRMWSLDPNIRDFIGDAREYAYDWNTPGGVPGFGPLSALDDVARMAARIVGEGPDSVLAGMSSAGDPASSRSQDREPGAPEHAAGGEPNVAISPGDTLPTNKEEAGVSDITLSHLPIAVVSDPASGTGQQQDHADVEKPPPRRHGGAMPL